MTAYIHIGTPKTGTTTIQHFLAKNRNKLIKKNIYYLNYKGGVEHWFIPSLLDTIWKKSNKNLDLFYQNKTLFLNQEQEIQIIKKEIEKLDSNQIILLSCEGIYQLCSSFELLNIFKEILYFIGISDIKIIVYFRRPADYFISYYTQAIKSGSSNYVNIFQKNPDEDIHFMIANQLKYAKIMKIYENIFERKNIIIKSFDKNRFLNNNLIDDFLSIFKINRDNSFEMINNINESLDILGVNICNILYEDREFSNLINNKNLIPSFVKIMEKFFSTRGKFLPKKTIYNNYNLFYNSEIEELENRYLNNQKLFSSINLDEYKENWYINEIKHDDFRQIVLFFKEIIILILTSQNKNLNHEVQKIKELQDTVDSLPFKKQILELSILEQDLTIKKLESKKLAKSLGVEMDIINHKINFIQANSAKAKIQNHLSYKLGEALIVNSKSLLGCIRIPFILSYIKDKHKQEQKIYQEKIKKDPSLKLPSLEDYPDYQEALKEKECFAYKLGEALIKANKTWYKGGYVKLIFEIGKLKREY